MELQGQHALEGLELGPAYAELKEMRALGFGLQSSFVYLGRLPSVQEEIWANLHRVMTEAQFQKWRVAYPSAIPDDVHIKLAKPSTDDVPCVDANDPNARIITFHPFYFSLGFTFQLSKLFREFLEVWLTNFCLLLVDICKKLELGLDMAKVSRALNIHPRFRKWRWLLSEYREEDGGLPLAKDVERWKDRGLLREVVRARSSSPVERQRDADVPLRSLGHLHQPKSGGRFGRSAHPSNHIMIQLLSHEQSSVELIRCRQFLWK
ncbi:unnamed protein product [Prunus brigantina]